MLFEWTTARAAKEPKVQPVPLKAQPGEPVAVISFDALMRPTRQKIERLLQIAVNVALLAVIIGIVLMMRGTFR